MWPSFQAEQTKECYQFKAMVVVFRNRLKRYLQTNNMSGHFKLWCDTYLHVEIPGAPNESIVQNH